MATRTLQFFMTLNETWQMLSLLVRQPGLRIYVDTRRSGGATEWLPETPLPSVGADNFFVFFYDKPEPVDLRFLREADIGKVGAVTLWVGGVDGKRLYINDLGAKSDWFEDGKIHDNPEPLKLHRKIKSIVVKNLRRGVVVTNIKYGGSSTYNDVMFSPGALQFYVDGGELMQRGVENTRFAPLVRADPEAEP